MCRRPPCRSSRPSPRSPPSDDAPSPAAAHLPRPTGAPAELDHRHPWPPYARRRDPNRPRRPRRSRPHRAARSAEARPTTNPEPAPVLATAVYLSGSSGLEVGGRYGFVIDDDRLRLVGPHDPSVTAFERPIAGILASISQGNLLLTVPDRKLGTFLAFRAVAGMSLEALVRSIAEAAEAAGTTVTDGQDGPSIGERIGDGSSAPRSWR